MDLVILDFSKAFDFWRSSNTTELGVRRMDGSSLSGRTQQFIVDGATSEKAPVISGAPQGTVLGRLLFLLFINDLPDCVTSRSRLFADECIVYRNIQTPKEWESKWGMSFHPNNCNVLRVTKKRTPLNSTYKPINSKARNFF